MSTKAEKKEDTLFKIWCRFKTCRRRAFAM